MADINLDNQGKKEIADGLNIYLANLHVLYTKLHNYHWNIKGKNFFQLHSKLEELYDHTAEEIDEVAERILQLGHKPDATMKTYLEKAQLKEAESKNYNGEEVINSLLEDFKKLIQELRKGIELSGKYNDEVTTDMAIGTLAHLEKNVWMLESYLG
ncbi:DNA starvation/stationary phase protection protein [Clostridium sp. D2Q-11]|uniref:DNA starvation/stationary phase protection protein n=1 Tax=Anaeromonas frigoriresistens TaxID=2683708 RepID=A0A942UY96_9FIRM|nr:DNA starvation/stationary phase protection protein [Anaeromonas frigoriresistens]MBS4539029.1 DNA starvation/stationary phase protection protein [Anaeromonas frigoriresistens]